MHLVNVMHSPVSLALSNCIYYVFYLVSIITEVLQL